jgi:hypothetical protein
MSRTMDRAVEDIDKAMRESTGRCEVRNWSRPVMRSGRYTSWCSVSTMCMVGTRARF